MAVVESKLKSGKLTFGGTGTPPVGGVEFACQATNVRVVPTFNEEGDTVETLCGDVLAPSTTTEWSLQGTHIQDWDAAGTVDSIVQYSWDNNLDVVPFSWQPNAGTTVISGTVQVRALEMGGDVNTRITSDFEWPIQGDPTATAVWPTATGTSTPTEPEPTEEPAYSA